MSVDNFSLSIKRLCFMIMPFKKRLIQTYTNAVKILRNEVEFIIKNNIFPSVSRYEITRLNC